MRLDEMPTRVVGDLPIIALVFFHVVWKQHLREILIIERSPCLLLNEFTSREGAQQDQQTGTGQMKVREQRIHGSKLIRRPDENIRRSGPGGDVPLR